MMETIVSGLKLGSAYLANIINMSFLLLIVCIPQKAAHGQIVALGENVS